MYLTVPLFSLNSRGLLHLAAALVFLPVPNITITIPPHYFILFWTLVYCLYIFSSTRKSTCRILLLYSFSYLSTKFFFYLFVRKQTVTPYPTRFTQLLRESLQITSLLGFHAAHWAPQPNCELLSLEWQALSHSGTEFLNLEMQTMEKQQCLVWIHDLAKKN